MKGKRMDTAVATVTLIAELKRRERDLAKTHRATGRDEAVVAAASYRDRSMYKSPLTN